jgi:hypothetical protein
MNIELHIFSNSTLHSPSTTLLAETYRSLIDVFKIEIPVKVWCDPNPNTKKSEEYIKNIQKIIPNVELTESLSDGYIKAIKSSKSDYLFMVEHDWLFLPTIKHTLEEILFDMENKDLWFLRFNKRHNTVKATDKWLKEGKGRYIGYCETPSLSNNPHIINRKVYIERALQYIKISKGSVGLEERFTKEEITGFLYGPLKYPNTIEHLDGRKKFNFKLISDYLNFFKI